MRYMFVSPAILTKENNEILELQGVPDGRSPTTLYTVTRNRRELRQGHFVLVGDKGWPTWYKRPREVLGRLGRDELLYRRLM